MQQSSKKTSQVAIVRSNKSKRKACYTDPIAPVFLKTKACVGAWIRKNAFQIAQRDATPQDAFKKGDLVLVGPGFPGPVRSQWDGAMAVIVGTAGTRSLECKIWTFNYHTEDDELPPNRVIETIPNMANTTFPVSRSKCILSPLPLARTLEDIVIRSPQEYEPPPVLLIQVIRSNLRCRSR